MISRFLLEDEAPHVVLVASGKGEKLLIYKYRRRKGYRRKNGHRQLFTAVKITGISVDGQALKA